MNKMNERPPRSCTVNAAAKYLGVSPKTIYTWKEAGLFTYIQIGGPHGKILIDYDELDNLRARFTIQRHGVNEYQGAH